MIRKNIILFVTKFILILFLFPVLYFIFDDLLELLDQRIWVFFISFAVYVIANVLFFFCQRISKKLIFVLNFIDGILFIISFISLVFLTILFFTGDESYVVLFYFPSAVAVVFYGCLGMFLTNIDIIYKILSKQTRMGDIPGFNPQEEAYLKQGGNNE